MKKIFRDRLTHEWSLMEGVNHYFTVHTIEPDKALIFDCEAFGFPVISTAWKLNQDLPYFLLNVLSLEFAELEMIERAGFVPPWSNPAIDFREYVSEGEENTVRVQLYRPKPKGFEVQQQYLKRDVLDRVISP